MSGSECRNRIIGKAAELFLRFGFSKVTMDGIIREIGISKKTLYQHFKSKDALISAVIDYHTDRISVGVRKIVNSRMEYIDKLSALWSFVGEMLTQMGPQFQEDLYRFRPDLWKRIEDIRSTKIMGSFKKLFDEGRRLGVLSKDLDLDLIALIYQGTIKGVMNPEVLMHSSFSAADSMRAILSIFMKGLLTDKSRKNYDRKFIKA